MLMKSGTFNNYNQNHIYIKHILIETILKPESFDSKALQAIKRVYLIEFWSLI